jgi:hypothetical protein
MSEPIAQSDYYVLRVRGHLAPRWAEWFSGLTMTHTASGETILSGPIEDQAALHGLLAKVRDLNLILISVIRIEAGSCSPGQAITSAQP